MLSLSIGIDLPGSIVLSLSMRIDHQWMKVVFKSFNWDKRSRKYCVKSFSGDILSRKYCVKSFNGDKRSREYCVKWLSGFWFMRSFHWITAKYLVMLHACEIFSWDPIQEFHQDPPTNWILSNDNDNDDNDNILFDHIFTSNIIYSFVPQWEQIL